MNRQEERNQGVMGAGIKLAQTAPTEMNAKHE